MKKAVLFLALLFSALLLSGCAFWGRADEPGLRVLVEVGEHYAIEVGYVSVEPGETASFLIRTDRDWLVTETDYRGEYRLKQTGGLTKLELLDVQVPTRVRLTLSHDARTIRYLANGGKGLDGVGTDVTESYDIREHRRPNVSIGTNLFARDGFTLTGWNTKPDGSGQRVGLGSRVTVADELTLYAQWAAWTDADRFTCEITEIGATVTGCGETGETLVIPETLDGALVVVLAAGSFADCPAKTVVLPKSLRRIENGAFAGAALRELHFFDNIEVIADACFPGCEDFSTLYISAIEDPYGYAFRRESVLADKFDLLIDTMGEDRVIFYGGCSMWYNLIGPDVLDAFEERYTVLNMGLNGVCSSLFQMELLKHFVTGRDILFHAPEISSVQQLLTNAKLGKHEDKLWCAMEYNYDLVSLLDIRVFDGGVFDSYRAYLDKKKPGGKYTDVYHDSKGYAFFDGETGCIPFIRTQSADELVDKVELDPAYLKDLSRLEEEYGFFTGQGVPVYVSFTGIDIDRVPEEQQGNVALMDELFREKFSAMEGVTVVGRLGDFLFHDEDCYDTVYHLLTEPARRCTAVWIRDLKEQLQKDGLWE